MGSRLESFVLSLVLWNAGCSAQSSMSGKASSDDDGGAPSADAAENAVDADSGGDTNVDGGCGPDVGKLAWGVEGEVLCGTGAELDSTDLYRSVQSCLKPASQSECMGEAPCASAAAIRLAAANGVVQGALQRDANYRGTASATFEISVGSHEVQLPTSCTDTMCGQVPPEVLVLMQRVQALDTLMTDEQLCR